MPAALLLGTFLTQGLEPAFTPPALQSGSLLAPPGSPLVPLRTEEMGQNTEEGMVSYTDKWKQSENAAM